MSVRSELGRLYDRTDLIHVYKVQLGKTLQKEGVWGEEERKDVLNSIRNLKRILRDIETSVKNMELG
jgi:hypothetical protein